MASLSASAGVSRMGAVRDFGAYHAASLGHRFLVVGMVTNRIVS
jgi:hypothetical protein